jgi:deazaflavin-dependent oxidoreductase (nitroreductase family)
MAVGKIKRSYLWFLKNTLNRVTSRVARRGRGPFSLIRHVGRKTGKTYETPVILARLGNDFVAELTYGPEVAWYRNAVAAGGCVVIFQGSEYRIDRIEPCDPEAGLRAFGFPALVVLRVLRRRDFRLLHNAGPAQTAS